MSRRVHRTRIGVTIKPSESNANLDKLNTFVSRMNTFLSVMRCEIYNMRDILGRAVIVFHLLITNIII